MNALRLSETFLDKNERLLRQVTGLVDDDDPRVRLQLALTLGSVKGAEAGKMLSRLAASAGQDTYLRAAIASSAVPHAMELASAEKSHASS